MKNISNYARFEEYVLQFILISLNQYFNKTMLMCNKFS